MPDKTYNLEDLASTIEADFISLQSGEKQRRTLIIAIGKSLLRARKQCNPERVTFKAWLKTGVARPLGTRQARQYMAIARCPSGFKTGMSINEGARICRYLHIHGREPIVK